MIFMVSRKFLSLFFAVLIMSVLAPISAFAALITASSGHDIYVANPGVNYRYGPSFIINADNTIDMWTCSPGAGGAWDYIRYAHSTDGGATFGSEQIVLQPNASPSPDYFSTCDPGVFKMGSYYYIGYTSTIDSTGNNNQLFVARSTSPTGPFDKWNGSGWGGNPQAFITYSGPATAYGIGEPSFVVKGSTLYIYYTYIDSTSNLTKVATASTTNANWPGAVTLAGTAITKSGVGGTGGDIKEDSTDHKYVDSLGKFIAINIDNRFQVISNVKIYESTDGLTYTPSCYTVANLKTQAHNAGISGDASGHLDTTKSNFIGYAYGSINSWGTWNTYLNPITIAAGSCSGSPANNYKIVNTSTGQVLDAYQKTNGQNPYMWSNGSQASAVWHIVDVGGTWDNIINNSTGQALDAYQKINGQNPYMWPIGGQQSQKWQINDIGGGNYNIVNQNTNQVLDAYQKTNGQLPYMWPSGGQPSQQWQLISVP
jgi:hypothetical protein